MSVNICNLKDLGKVIEQQNPDLIVSAIPIELMTTEGVQHLKLPIEDIYNLQMSGYKAAIRTLLAAEGKNILVHCEMGKSRSAGLALVKLYQMEGKEGVIQFLNDHPEAEPNPLILLFGDEILKSGGELLQLCKERYKGRHL